MNLRTFLSVALLGAASQAALAIEPAIDRPVGDHSAYAQPRTPAFGARAAVAMPKMAGAPAATVGDSPDYGRVAAAGGRSRAEVRAEAMQARNRAQRDVEYFRHDLSRAGA